MLSVDIPTALVVMALVTFVTRAGGLFIMTWIPVSRRVERFLDALSGSVMVALVVPMTLSGDLAMQLAVAAAVAVMLATRNAVLAVAAAMVAVLLVRAVI